MVVSEAGAPVVLTYAIQLDMPIDDIPYYAELATRYFTGHGPATVQDFAWWSGLPAADARADQLCKAD